MCSVRVSGEKSVGGRIILLSQIPNSLRTCKVSGSCFTFILTCKEGVKLEQRKVEKNK